MDFNSMMNAASKNAAKASKQMVEIDSEVSKEKNQVKAQLEAEKRLRIEMQRRKAEQAKAAERRREEERRKNFAIPKKNEAPVPEVNQDAIKAYYDKQEKMKREKAKQAEIEKERLMKLRMQANGGKATKKLGKHFGLDPVELQIRFGGNNEHVETLQKRKWREEEEADMEADKYRTGVFKALQMKRKNEEKLRSTVSGPHRVSTSKSNSLAGLCSRHEKTRDTFSPPKDGKKPKDEQRDAKPEKKRIQPAAPVDFKSLMAAASNITAGKSVNMSHFEAKPSKSVIERKNGASGSGPSSSSSSRPISSNLNNNRVPMKNNNNGRDKEREREKERQREKEKAQKEKDRAKESQQQKSSSTSSSSMSKSHQGSSSSYMKSSSSAPRPPKEQIIKSLKSVDIDFSTSESKKVVNGDEKKKTEGKPGRFQKGPTPPPMIPAAVPGKKYLPGDVRYKEAMAMARLQQGSSSSYSGGGGGASSSSGSSKPSGLSERDRVSNVRDMERQREKDRERARQLKRERADREDREFERAQKMKKMDKQRSDISRNHQMRREAELRQQQHQKNRNSDRPRKEERRGGDSFFRGGDDNSDAEDDYEEDYEDDYDSDMDDFIDDTEMDMDGMSRREFEDTLKMVNRKYDTKKWSQRERDISERDMVSNYRRIQTEENFSKRAGMLEDLREASKGRSVRL